MDICPIFSKTLLSELTELSFATDFDAIEHINMSKIEQDNHRTQHSSWLFSIGKMFAKKRKKRKVSTGNVMSTYSE